MLAARSADTLALAEGLCTVDGGEVLAVPTDVADADHLRLNPHPADQDEMTGEQRVQAARDRRAGERAVTQ